MDYKYRKGQIFGKRLKVPKHILQSVYNNCLSFSEFVDYELEDKVPISCLNVSDRQIVERFGIEKAKLLDWKLINNAFYNINFRDLLMTIEPSVDDINKNLYELVKNQINPDEYSPKMKDVYSDRLFNISDETDKNKNIKTMFNHGHVTAEELIRNWELFKDKDLSYCLLKDKQNEVNITDQELKKFMNTFRDISELIVDNVNIYSFIHKLNNSQNESEKQEYIRQVTDNILDKTIGKGYESQVIKLSDNQYKELFKYSSLGDYLKNFYVDYIVDGLLTELQTLPTDYLFSIPIPFEELKNNDILKFIYQGGLKNIVDFDNESNHFFTKNNCKVLQMAYKWSRGNHGIRDYDSNLPGSKEEFYTLLRNSIISTYYNINYRDIVGKFRDDNPDLFLSKDAPEELQKAFYTGSITPHLISEHPNYISYLNGKNLASCFKLREVTLDYSDVLNFYDFLGERTDFNGVMNFLIDYRDILDIIFEKKTANNYDYEIKFSKDNNIGEVKKEIDDVLKKILIKEGIVYPKNIPDNLKENHSSMFLNSNAPRELQEAFYNRTINSEFILSNPTYKEYLKSIDLELLYKYMPVSVISGNDRYTEVNLTSAIKQIFSTEDGFDIMLLYGKYLESVFEANKLQNFKFNPNFSKNDFLDEIDRNILQAIIYKKMKYDEDVPSHFKKKNPTLFLDQNIPQEIRSKFYNREFTLDDFNSNPDLLEIFDNTNIVCGFSENLSWIIPLFNDSDNIKIANYNRLKTIAAYSKIQDEVLQNYFEEYVMEFGNSIDIEKIEYISKVVSRLSLSNSSEIFTFREELATQILNSANPLESLDKIEDVFIRNNIPTVGKIYSCFEILHPDFQGFNFDNSMISPVLKESSTMSKKWLYFRI